MKQRGRLNQAEMFPADRGGVLRPSQILTTFAVTGAALEALVSSLIADVQ